ncbi:SGNH/GDSL hydrolase family protein [Dyadobacter bucti]|uniref:SGNH/GDSL hydrolase family protein n=1 Tax=Dyadobacter bucti TaxID=2572203 RepID=UPI003F72B623
MTLHLIFLLFLHVDSGPSRFVHADNESISYTGRFDFSDRAKPRFMYSACAISAGFTGTSIAIKMRDDSLRNWFNVRIDDQLFKFESADSSGVYQLAQDLPDKEHRITISRRTESHGGNTTFEGFIIDSGKSLFRLPPLTRTVEIIGNSLTCGYGNEGKSREEHFKYETENADLAYGALVAKALNANYVAVCRSGIGMHQAYGGDKDFVQPKLYDEIVAGSKAQWNYAANQPDVVLIELGANDLVKTLDSALFVNDYIAFVKKLRSQYYKADIICAAGPNLPGDRSLAFQSYVRSVQAQFATTDKKVHYFDFGTIDAHGSDWHQNLKEHRQMADALLPFIKKLKNWR